MALSSILDIGRVAEARDAVYPGAVALMLVGLFELLLVLAAYEPSGASVLFPVGMLAVLVAQIGLVGLPQSALYRFSLQPWRSFALLGLTFLFFVVVGAEFENMQWQYFVLPFIVLGSLIGVALHGFQVIRKERRSAVDPAVLDGWLQKSRPACPSLPLLRPRLPRAVPWFVAGALVPPAAFLFVKAYNLWHVRYGVAVPEGLAVTLSAYCLHRGRRHVKLLADEARRCDSRAPVLILRTFKDDAIKIDTPGFGQPVSLEELLASQTEQVGPPIAIGEPGERLPPLGAAREYLAGADWQTRVGALMGEAALLILILGESESLLWELRSAVERGREKLVVVLPPLRTEADLQQRWRHFVTAHMDLLAAGFPPHLPAGRIVLVFFFLKGKPVFVVSRKRTRWHYALAIRSAVHATRGD